MAIRSSLVAVSTAAFVAFGLMACGSAPVASEGNDEEVTASDEEALRLGCWGKQCKKGTHCEWRKFKATCVADAPSTSGECTTDADCRVEADYCTGCNCLALSRSENVPACSGPGVRCFVDPCMNKSAKCSSGQCVVN